MYESLTIKHFRGIEAVSIENLSRMNLIVGRNNVGKTSVLEALRLVGRAWHASAATRLGELRGQSGADAPGIWAGLFANQDTTRPIEIVVRHGGDERSLHIAARMVAASEDGVLRAREAERVAQLDMHFSDGKATHSVYAVIGKDGAARYPGNRPLDDAGLPTTFVPAHVPSSLALQAEQLSQHVKAKREQEVTDILRIVDPRITRLVVGAEASGVTIFADVGLPVLIPLALTGEGTMRLFSFAVELSDVHGGVLLIDEIDAGLHYSVLVDVLQALRASAVAHDVQIVATTHSDDLIRAALEAFAGAPEELRIIRLGRKDGRSTAVVYDEQSLPAVADANLEVRG